MREAARILRADVSAVSAGIDTDGMPIKKSKETSA